MREPRDSLFANKSPVDSDDAPVREAFQRFGKQEISCASPFFESRDSKICPTLAFLNRHDSVVFYLRLQMPVGRRLLPKGVNLWSTGGFYYMRKAHRFRLEQFHTHSARPGGRALPKSPPENYGKEDQTTVAAFLPWRGS